MTKISDLPEVRIPMELEERIKREVNADGVPLSEVQEASTANPFADLKRPPAPEMVLRRCQHGAWPWPCPWPNCINGHTGSKLTIRVVQEGGRIGLLPVKRRRLDPKRGMSRCGKCGYELAVGAERNEPWSVTCTKCMTVNGIPVLPPSAFQWVPAKQAPSAPSAPSQPSEP